ncbi:MAG: cysteine peptidase family C39 domain-containing protein [Polyangia bacterium]
MRLRRLRPRLLAAQALTAALALSGVLAPGPPRLALARPPATTTTTMADPAPRLPPDAVAIPIVAQQTDYSCGPAALASILRHHRVWKGRERELYTLLRTHPEHGTLPEDLAAGARRFGLQAAVERNMTLERLRALLGERKLVILDVQAWPDDGRPLAWSERWDDGHYVVLIGMDERFGFLMDPSVEGAFAYVPLDELVARWHDVNRRTAVEELDIRLGVVIWREAPADRPATGGAVSARTGSVPPRRLVRLE